MRLARSLVVVGTAGALAACGGASELSDAGAGRAGSPISAHATSALTSVRATEAERRPVDVCGVVDLAAVRESFGETGPLSTQPMGEANGPACGVPHPRKGGYLLVVQFQPLDRWERHAASGRSVDTLAYPAVATDASTLFVRDDERGVVAMVLAPPDPTDTAPAGAALRFATRLYPRRAR